MYSEKSIRTQTFAIHQTKHTVYRANRSFFSDICAEETSGIGIGDAG
jgi:hypothetical protein